MRKWMALTLLLASAPTAALAAPRHRARQARQRREALLLALSPLAPLFVLLPPVEEEPPIQIKRK